MKAIVLDGFGSVDHFRLIETDIPLVNEDQVLVKIKATAFNPIDYQMRQGRREKELMTSPILGREMSGVIVDVGDRVSGFKTGDEIMAASGSRGSNGSYAEYMSLSPKVIALKPAGVSFETAAAIPSAGLTAWQSFTRMNISPDQSIFITGGSGAVGSFLIKLLIRKGVKKIYTTAGSPASRKAIKALGLVDSHILDYNTADLAKDLIQVNDGESFDFTVDIVGAGISEIAAEALKVNGTYLDITFLGTEKTREILFDKGAVVLNISNYAYALKNNLDWYGQTLSTLSGLIEAGEIIPPAINIVGELSVKTVQDAHLLMENNQTQGKKIIMTV